MVEIPADQSNSVKVENWTETVTVQCEEPNAKVLEMLFGICLVKNSPYANLDSDTPNEKEPENG
ncbi:MAG: hypothetical protein PHW63_08925 [Alphaproteobacteria bacterium]|nr:hypothetical protein [Alphaproteobacteria bacterium]